MTTSRIVLFSVLGLILLIFVNGCSTYNNLVKKEEGVTKTWKQVEVQYQARMDKTKNLFEIVMANAEYEKTTLKDIVEARANATRITVNIDDMTQENLDKFQKAQDQFGQALGRLLAVSESYPDLKAAEAFRDFQAQYEGMENRIAKARGDFNDIVGDYNTYVRRFPRNIWAGMFGFEKKAYFQAQQGAETAPDIRSMRNQQ
jgi:LemA protein